jgi:hypothetical protein
LAKDEDDARSKPFNPSLNASSRDKPASKPIPKEYLDAQGRIDMDKAPTELIVDQAAKVQDATKRSGQRIINMLSDCQDIAVNSKEELAKQTAKLMVIDEQLNKIESATKRTTQVVKRLRKGMMADKLHCCLGIYIFLNCVLFVALLVMIFVLKKA